MAGSELTVEERRVLESLDAVAGLDGAATIDELAAATGLAADYLRGMLLRLGQNGFVDDDRDPDHVSSPHFRLADKGRLLLHPLADEEKQEVRAEPGAAEGAEPGGGEDASRDRTSP